MKGQKFLPGIVLLLICHAFCVQAQKTTYHDASGRQTGAITDSGFSRVVHPDVETNYYTVTEYFVNGKIRSKALSRSENMLQYEGQKLDFFESGQLKMSVNYKMGIPTDKIHTYYPNGKPYYIASPSLSDHGLMQHKIVYAYDTAGQQILFEGNGNFTKYGANFDHVEMSGPMQKSEWNGKISGFDEKNQITFTEEYKMGILLYGNAKDQYGNDYTYKTKLILPRFNKGDAKVFEQEILANLSRKDAFKVIQRFSRISVKYIIDNSGNLTSVRFTTPLGEKTEQEIRDVFLMAPKKWYPAVSRGVCINYELSLEVGQQTFGREYTIRTAERPVSTRKGAIKY